MCSSPARAARRGPAGLPPAHLFNVAIEVWGTGVGVRDVAAGFLGIEPVDLVASTAHLLDMHFHLAALALAEDLERYPPARLIGEDVEEFTTSPPAAPPEEGAGLYLGAPHGTPVGKAGTWTVRIPKLTRLPTVRS